MMTKALLGTALAMWVAWGQEQAPTPAPAPSPSTPTPGPTPSPNIPSTPSRTPQPTERQPQQDPFDPSRRSPFPEMQRPIFLSGKVVLEDGTPPPEPVVIERICNAQVRPEGYTDSKGRFSIQLGQNQAMMADASVSSASDAGGFGDNQQSRNNPFGGRGISERDLMGCELRASLPGYRSEVVQLSGRRIMDNPDVGTIILRRLAGVEGLSTSFTSMAAPKDARKAYDKANEAVKKQKWPEAQKELEKAVGLYPKYAVAWHKLGQIHQQQGRAEDARRAYEQAIAADNKYVNPYLQLALLAAQEKKWQEVADTTDRVIKLNPLQYPHAFFYNSVANYNLQKWDAAEASAREAVKLDPQHRIPKAQHLLGLLLADKGDFAGAAEHMKGYLQHAPKAGDADMVRQQLSEIEKRLGQVQVTQQQ